MTTVEDLTVERQVAAVQGVAELHGWPFERLGTRSFRVSLTARNGDVYELEVECEGFPVHPAAFYWRNPATGNRDDLADTPQPYNYFHGTGRICAPWNRLASTSGGPHTEWRQAGWQEQAETQGTRTLGAMVLRIYYELRSERYKGRRKC